MTGEISFDLLMEENMAFVEGTFRIGGGTWQVFVFSRYPCKQPAIKASSWDSGISGLFVRFPQSEILNKSVVNQVLSERLGVTDWVEVRGPDSMQLR